MSEETGGLFARPIVGRGLAVGDIDNDGDPDLLMTTNGGPVYQLRNDGVENGGKGNSITLTLRGSYPNLDALGAVVTVTAGEIVQSAMVKTGSSYLSQSSRSLIFGLGEHEKADRVEVVWPDGTGQAVENLAAGGRYEIEATSADGS